MCTVAVLTARNILANIPFDNGFLELLAWCSEKPITIYKSTKNYESNTHMRSERLKSGKDSKGESMCFILWGIDICGK